MSKEDILVAYRSACSRLSDNHRELGAVNQAIISARSSAYSQATAAGLAVTAARESAEAAVAHFKADAALLQGDIDAELATLRWLDVHLAHLDEG